MRYNVLNLRSSQWNDVVGAFRALKQSGQYDEFTRLHVHAMMTPTLLPGETGTLRNVAHRGPSFFVWHRQTLLEFEQALRATKSNWSWDFGLPYWSWENLGSSWRDTSRGVWTLVGGNGDPRRGNRIQNGPFANWNSIIYNNGSYVNRNGIIRNFAATGAPAPVLTNMPTYDVAPWNESSDVNLSFRQQAETKHNAIHNLIGGDMAVATSPNDPIFWLHHSNVDRIFARWTSQTHGPYLPVTGGPPGHNLHDTLADVAATNVTPFNLLSSQALGVSYDNVW